MLRRSILQALAATPLLPLAAHAVGPAPAPLSPPVTLTIGYQKVGHLAPMILIAEPLQKLGVDAKLVEFVRYADARTALLAGSLDVASIGPGDLAIALAQGSKDIVGLMGVGASDKYVIGRTGVKLDTWADLAGKTVAIAPGSAVWFQFAATLTENKIPYTSFHAVNIQGGGSNFDQALKAGDVDALVTWEPFESVPVMAGYGFFAKNLEYGHSQAVGAELGMIVTTRDALAHKKAAVQRFVWAYLQQEEALRASPPAFAAAYARFTGLDPAVAAKAAEVITLGGVITPSQIERQAKLFYSLGVIPKDVSSEVPAAWDGSLVQQAEGA